MKKYKFKSQILRMGLVIFAVYGFAETGFAQCPGDTQSEMNQCAGAHFKAEDQKLGSVYSKLEKSSELIAAERAWIAYRDAECAYQIRDFKGGTIVPTLFNECLADLTAARVQQLLSDQNH